MTRDYRRPPGAPPGKEVCPGTKSRATTTTPIAGIDLTALLGHHQPQNGYSAPNGEDTADLEVLIAALERGFRIAVRCRECRRFLTAPSSVRDFLGPRCRERLHQACDEVVA